MRSTSSTGGPKSFGQCHRDLLHIHRSVIVQGLGHQSGRAVSKSARQMRPLRTICPAPGHGPKTFGVAENDLARFRLFLFPGEGDVAFVSGGARDDQRKRERDQGRKWRAGWRTRARDRIAEIDQGVQRRPCRPASAADGAATPTRSDTEWGFSPIAVKAARHARISGKVPSVVSASLARATSRWGTHQGLAP